MIISVNIPIQVPEYVLVGKQGHGKSLFLEALFGHPLSVGSANKRPLFVNVVMNSSLPTDEPKITLKRDVLVPSGSASPSQTNTPDDIVLSITDLPKELEKRNAAAVCIINQVLK